MVFRTFMGGVGLLLVCIVWMAATRNRAALDRSAERAVVVRAAEGGAQADVAEGSFLGVLITEESVDLAARVDGRVETVKVGVGAKVRQGEVVATLEARAPQQSLAIAEAELFSMRAEQEVAELALESAGERLRRREAPNQLATGAISQEEVNAARYEQRMAAARLEVARGRVREHEARVAQLRQQVTETSIRAPFEGVVAGRFVHPGALVRSGQPLLHVLRQGIPRVRFAVPTPQVPHLTVGRVMSVEVAERGLVLRGRVTQVAPEVDVASRLVFALLVLEEVEEASLLPAGMVVRVRFKPEQAQPANPEGHTLGAAPP